MTLGDLEALRGVVKFPVRIKCATLSWNTLAQGLEEVSQTSRLTRSANSTHKAVTPPLSWLVMSMVTRFQLLDQSG